MTPELVVHVFKRIHPTILSIVTPHFQIELGGISLLRRIMEKCEDIAKEDYLVVKMK